MKKTFFPLSTFEKQNWEKVCGFHALLFKEITLTGASSIVACWHLTFCACHLLSQIKPTHSSHLNSQYSDVVARGFSSPAHNTYLQLKLLVILLNTWLLILNMAFLILSYYFTQDCCYPKVWKYSCIIFYEQFRMETAILNPSVTKQTVTNIFEKLTVQ